MKITLCSIKQCRLLRLVPCCYQFQSFLQKALQNLFHFYAVQYTIQCFYWLSNVTKAVPVNNLFSGKVLSGRSSLLSNDNFIYCWENQTTTGLCNRPWATAQLRIKFQVLLILCHTLFNQVSRAQ